MIGTRYRVGRRASSSSSSSRRSARVSSSAGSVAGSTAWPTSRARLRRRGGPGPCRDPSADPVEPAAERIVDADGPGLADQDQEGRLERVLDVVGIAQDAAADAQDHRADAPHAPPRTPPPRPARPVPPGCAAPGNDRAIPRRSAPCCSRRKRACSGAPCVAHPALSNLASELCVRPPHAMPARGGSLSIFPGDLATSRAGSAPPGPGTQEPAPPGILIQNVDPTPGGTGRSRSGQDRRAAMVGGASYSCRTILLRSDDTEAIWGMAAPSSETPHGRRRRLSRSNPTRRLG